MRGKPAGTVSQLGWLGLLVALGSARGDELPPLIPRATLFANPERATPQISPDGTRLAWLQPDERGTLQIWSRPLDGSEAAQPRTHDRRDIRHYFWAFNGDLVYFQDRDGDENYRLFVVGRADGKVRDLGAVAGIRGSDYQLSPRRPNEMLILRGRPHRGTSLFARSGKPLFDPWIIDLETGRLTQGDENPGDATSWVADQQLAVRGRIRASPGGGSELEIRTDASAPWRSLLEWGLEESVQLLHFTADGKQLYLLDNLRSDTTRVDRVDIASGKLKVVGADASSDVSGIDAHPTTGKVRAAAFNRARVRWRALEDDVAGDLAAVAKVDAGDLDLLGGDQKDRHWVLSFDRDIAPPRYYVWDRDKKQAIPLFASRPGLEKVRLSPTEAVEIRARDGLSLPCYLTVPAGRPPARLPTVLDVHGGPWIRDTWGFDNDVQWLANRGYAVLQVNYRGSQGFGKKFRNAGMKQLARRMHDDLVDAVRWAVDKGVADPKRVAILGDSYGGYAALVGVTFTPEVFACGVDMFGPSNLVTVVRSFPPYWEPFLATTWYAFAGDPKDPVARADMESRSPLFRAGAIRVPLLIGQGGNDPRVPQRESEQMVAAIEKTGGAAIYVVYSDEGHGFLRPENRIDFFARTERFLGTCLGGRVEPMEGDPFPGSTAVQTVVGPTPRPPAP